MSDEDVSKIFKKGSDNIVEGLEQLAKGLERISRSLASVFNDHPMIKWLILAPVSAIVGNFGIRLLSRIHIYFFGETVVVSRDMKLGTFPAPVGFSLWVLSSGFVLISLVAYFRIVTLRQRIADIEKKVDNS